MGCIDLSQRKAEVIDFIDANIRPGTILYTDGDPSYDNLPARLGITHEKIVMVTAKDPAHELLPAVHRVASLLKRWLIGTLHDGQSADHLNYYLDVGISPSAGRVVMRLDGTGVPTRGVGRRSGCCEASRCCTS